MEGREPIKRYCVLAVLLICITVPYGYGQTDGGDWGSTPLENSPFPIKDYSGDLLNRPNLLGYWHGRRNELACSGIIFETDLTQVFQGNARGGKKTSGAWGYSGSTDYWLKLDTQRMGH